MTDLNDTALAAYRDLISVRLQELSEENARGAEGQSVVELDQQAVGRLSRMDALQNQAMSKAQAVRRASEAQRLHAALARLDDGSYGICEDCGEPIPEGRLKLDLTTLRCVSCASG